MPLKVTTRKDRAGLWIMGRVGGIRVRKRAASDRAKLAREEAAAIEAETLRRQWHGERRGAKRFAEAAMSYLDTPSPRTGRLPSQSTKRRLHRILLALGDVNLADVDQGAVDRVRRTILGRSPSPSTIRRGVITPIRAILTHAARRGWCDRPAFEVPKEPEGRTKFLLPDEAERLIAAAAAHLQPLIVFALGTGARMSEAIELDWRDVDLRGAMVTFWRTKRGKSRKAALPPRAVAELTAIEHREGPVFRWSTNRRANGTAKRVAVYADRGREGGGQIKRGFAGAVRRAGLDPELTPHDLRHTWASWHYALHRDLLRLKIDGQWSTVQLVERYAHLLPAGNEEAIRAFYAGRHIDTETAPDRAKAL